MSGTKYRRILLKLSGEALACNDGHGIDFEKASAVCGNIKACAEEGVQIGIVVGAGNFWRGRQGTGMDKTRADHMGMLATMLNCLALKDIFLRMGAEAEVFSTVSMPQIAPFFLRDAAVDALNSGKIAIFGCGTGSPFFTTDTAAILKAVEINADIALFAKNVDGVYSADPNKDSNAKRYDRISYDDLLYKHLKVIDATAAALCQDNNLPVLLFALGDGSNILRAVRGENLGTVLNN